MSKLAVMRDKLKEKKFKVELNIKWVVFFIFIFLSSCVQYPWLVRIKYRDYIWRDTVIFVRKKFEYIEINNPRYPYEKCYCFLSCFNGKKRWGIWYETRDWDEKWVSEWDELQGHDHVVYVIFVDYWGRKIEEGDMTCPCCEAPFVGKYRAYHRNGRIYAIGQRNENGLRYGEWHFYDKKGHKDRTLVYSIKDE